MWGQPASHYPGENIGVHSINSISTTFLTFQIPFNNQSVNIPFEARKIVAIRVHTLTWLAPPIGDGDLLMYISSPEVGRYFANQSGYFLNNPVLPNSFNQLFQKRDIIAVYNTANAESGIPNAFTPNFEQPMIRFDESAKMDRISFTFEKDDGTLVAIQPSQRVQLVLQFFLETYQ
jgi:hypothetical protein